MMLFVLIMYPNMLVVPVICVFITPSLILNTWFVFASKSSQAVVAHKINFLFFKAYMVLIGVIYLFNIILAFGNFTLIDLGPYNNYMATVSMFIGHFCL